MVGTAMPERPQDREQPEGEDGGAEEVEDSGDEDDMHLSYKNKSLRNMTYTDFKAAVKELGLKPPNKRNETFRLEVRHRLKGKKGRPKHPVVVAFPSTSSRSGAQKPQGS